MPNLFDEVEQEMAANRALFDALEDEEARRPFDVRPPGSPEELAMANVAGEREAVAAPMFPKVPAQGGIRALTPIEKLQLLTGAYEKITPRTLEKEAEARTKPTTYLEAAQKFGRAAGEGLIESAPLIAATAVAPEVTLPAFSAMGVRGLLESLPRMASPEATGPERLQAGLESGMNALMVASPLAHVAGEKPTILEQIKSAIVPEPAEIKPGEWRARPQLDPRVLGLRRLAENVRNIAGAPAGLPRPPIVPATPLPVPVHVPTPTPSSELKPRTEAEAAVKEAEAEAAAPAEQWIKFQASKPEAAKFGKGIDQRLKVVSEWIREGKTPDGPIPKETMDSLMRELGPTKDLETGEVLDVSSPEWPRTGTLIDYLKKKSQQRIPAPAEPAVAPPTEAPAPTPLPVAPEKPATPATIPAASQTSVAPTSKSPIGDYLKGGSVTIATGKFGDTPIRLGLRRMGGGQSDLSVTISAGGESPVVLWRLNPSAWPHIEDIIEHSKTRLQEGAILNQLPIPSKKVTPVQKSLGTGNPDSDAKLAQYRKMKRAGAPMTAMQEQAFSIYEAQAKSDPSKWSVGNGVGWRVYKQINRGFRIAEIDPERKLAKVIPVADTGLTVTGGGMEGVGPEWVHVADLVRDKKYDAPKVTESPPPAPIPAAAAEVAKLAATEQPTPPPEAGIVGMGAAAAGEKPTAPQIVQLTEELKRIEAKPVTFGEKVRESFNLAEHRSLAGTAFGRSIAALKTTRDYLIKKWDGVKDWDDIKRVKGELSAEINTRGWSLRQFEKATRKAIPRRADRDAISSWLDNGGDPAKLKTALEGAPRRYKQSYEDALKLPPELKLAAEHVQSYFEARLQEAIDAGVLEEGIADYIHRIYKRDTPFKQRILNQVQSGVLNTRTPGLAMQRVFRFDYEAEAAGYPIVKDFLPRLVDYEYSLARVIADRAAVKRFMEIRMSDGRPMIDVAGVGVPIETAEGVTEAMLIKPQFKRGDPNEPGAKTYRKDYVERNDYPAFRRWKWVEKDEATGRDTFVQGDVLVHPEAAVRIDALMARSALRRSKLGTAALGVSSTFKQTMLDFSGFHQVQIAVHGAEHRAFPWTVIKDIDLADPKVQGLLKGGLNIGGEFHAFDYREGLVGRSLSRYIPGLGELMQSYHEYLFRDYIPRIKTTMALHALERNRARYPGMSEEQLKYLTSKQANAAFGGLNYIVMERSKTAQDLSRLILLAPDFLEARGSFAAQALQRLGKTGDQARGLTPWSNEQRQALLLGALTLYVTARIANKMIDDQYHFEPENLFSVVYNGHSYSLRTVQGDLLHLWDKPFQFWLNRLNPVFGRSFLELGTGRDYFGRKRSRMELAWDLFANIRPIAFRNSQERALWESMLNAFGVQAKRWSEIDKAFALAKQWKESQGITERGEFIYDAEKDPLRPLKLALNHGNEGEAVSQIRKLLESGYKRDKLNQYFERYASMPFTGSRSNDLKWKKGLSADELQTVALGQEHKKTIYKLYLKARSQYDAAKAVPYYAP